MIKKSNSRSTSSDSGSNLGRYLLGACMLLTACAIASWDYQEIKSHNQIHPKEPPFLKARALQRRRSSRTQYEELTFRMEKITKRDLQYFEPLPFAHSEIPAFTASKMYSIRMPNYTRHAIRENNLSAAHPEWNWNSNFRTVSEAGWRWCGLPKDIWVCWEDTYRSHLATSRRLNQSRIFQTLPKNSTILIEGNSHLAELVLSLTCGSEREVDDFDVWAIDTNHSNSFLFHAPGPNITLLLVSNDENLGSRPLSSCQHIAMNNNTLKPSVLIGCYPYWKSDRLVTLLNYQPDLILVGKLNFEPETINRIRVFNWQQRFPGRVLSWREAEQLLGHTCSADAIRGPQFVKGSNCGHRKNGHTCFPSGNVYRAAEQLWDQLSSEVQMRKGNRA